MPTVINMVDPRCSTFFFFILSVPIVERLPLMGSFIWPYFLITYVFFQERVQLKWHNPCIGQNLWGACPLVALGSSLFKYKVHDSSDGWNTIGTHLEPWSSRASRGSSVVSLTYTAQNVYDELDLRQIWIRVVHIWLDPSSIRFGWGPPCGTYPTQLFDTIFSRYPTVWAKWSFSLPHIWFMEDNSLDLFFHNPVISTSVLH